MHSLSRVVVPLMLSVDGEPIADHETAMIEGLRGELQRWWLSYGFACLLADVIEVPYRGDWDPAAFHRPGGAFLAALTAVRNRYPALIGGEHIPLVFLKGVDQAELGSLGWGGTGFATVSWDALLEAQRPGKAHWLAGVAAHEIGHGLGWPHNDQPTGLNVMWSWWNWPGVGAYAAAEHPTMKVLSES
jgi:hypothetical protein